MRGYLNMVMLLNALVNFLLLLSANRLCGYRSAWKRPALAAALGGIYSGACLQPGFYFLGNALWRMVSLLLVSWVAYGISKSSLRRAVVFALLNLALGGLAVGMDHGKIWSLVASAIGIFAMCILGFRDSIGSVTYIPVVLNYCGKRLHLTALQDSGNTLKDPVTGSSVLVVDADIAQKLTGLTAQQLRCPVEAMQTAALPGLRLIPYHAVGQPSGLMLALRFQDVTIGKWKGSSLVAFSPNGLSREGAYQALTGGVS